MFPLPIRRRIHRALLAAGCLAAGWGFQCLLNPGNTSAKSSAPPIHSTPSAQTFSSPWAALPADWEAVWESVSSLAERELLLAVWKEKNPERLLHFLRVLPPLSLPHQRQLEADALTAWGLREPVPAFEFACRHEGQYQATDPLLRHWLDKDLDTGLKLLTSRLLPESIAPGRPEDLSWMLKDPAKVCASLVTMRNTTPPFTPRDEFSDSFSSVPAAFRRDDQRSAFLKAAFAVWADGNPQAAIAFLPSLRSRDAVAALRGVSAALPIPEAAQLLETFARPEIAALAAPDFARRWAEADFESALKWSVENLSPSAGNASLETLGQTLLRKPSLEDAVLRRALAETPCWAWDHILRTDTREHRLALRLLPLADDDQTLRQLARKIGYSPAAPPIWAANLPQELTERLHRLFSPAD